VVLQYHVLHVDGVLYELNGFWGQVVPLLFLLLLLLLLLALLHILHWLLLLLLLL
jgi:hypothetical protein